MEKTLGLIAHQIVSSKSFALVELEIDCDVYACKKYTYVPDLRVRVYSGWRISKPPYRRVLESVYAVWGEDWLKISTADDMTDAIVDYTEELFGEPWKIEHIKAMLKVYIDDSCSPYY